jgi:trigger factor
MQVTETKSEGLKREYSVVVDAAALNEKIDEKLETVRADFHMKGFRKGKAPTPLLKKMFGKSLLGEAVQESVDGALRDLIEESGDRPAQQPDVKIVNEDFNEGDDLQISIAYEKLPDVPEVDFAAIELERLAAAVDDDAVQEALANLAASANNYEAREGDPEAAEGDQVVIDFVGRIDGEAFEGGAAEDFPLVIGSDQFIPGFEGQLVGARTGEEREVAVTFPEEYGAENLAGKDAVFSCTIKEIRGPVPLEIGDEMAKRFGADTLEELKNQVTERLTAEYKGAARSHLKRRLLDRLDEAVSFDLPASLVEEEANQIAHQLWHEENPDHQGHDHDKIEPTEEHRRLAERRVRLGLLLADVGQRNEINVSEAEINAALMRQASQYPGREREFLEFARSNEAMLQQVRSPIFEEKVVDFVIEIAKVTEKPVTKDELQKALEELDED